MSTIKEHPGMSETDVAEAMAVRRQVVNYHLKKLESMNLVTVNKDGNAVRCFVNDAEIERSSVDLGYAEMETSTGEEM